jgi:hypothetical protein
MELLPISLSVASLLIREESWQRAAVGDVDQYSKLGSLLFAARDDLLEIFALFATLGAELGQRRELIPGLL